MTELQSTVVRLDPVSQYDAEFKALRQPLTLPEGEDTWQGIDKALERLAALIRGGGYKAQSFSSFIKSIQDIIIHSLLTERSRLSGTAMDLVTAMGEALKGEGFGPYVEPLGGTVMRLCGRTNRVFSSRAQNTLLSLIQNTRLPSILPLLCEGLREKSKLMRLGVAEPLRLGMTLWSKEEVERDVMALEDVLVNGVQDPAPEVRTKCRATFTLYAAMFPERQERFIERLPPNVLKAISTSSSAPSSIRATLKKSSSFSSFSSSSTGPGGGVKGKATSRPSLREVMAAKRSEVAKAKKLEAEAASSSSTLPISTSTSIDSMVKTDDEDKGDGEKTQGEGVPMDHLACPPPARASLSVPSTPRPAKRVHSGPSWSVQQDKTRSIYPDLPKEEEKTAHSGEASGLPEPVHVTIVGGDGELPSSSSDHVRVMPPPSLVPVKSGEKKGPGRVPLRPGEGMVEDEERRAEEREAMARVGGGGGGGGGGGRERAGVRSLPRRVPASGKGAMPPPGRAIMTTSAPGGATRSTSRPPGSFRGVGTSKAVALSKKATAARVRLGVRRSLEGGTRGVSKLAQRVRRRRSIMAKSVFSSAPTASFLAKMVHRSPRRLGGGRRSREEEGREEEGVRKRTRTIPSPGLKRPIQVAKERRVAQEARKEAMAALGRSRSDLSSSSGRREGSTLYAPTASTLAKARPPLPYGKKGM